MTFLSKFNTFYNISFNYKSLNYISILIFLLLITLNSCSNNTSNTSKNNILNTQDANFKKQKLFLANFKTSDNINDLSDSKGQAAFNLALDLSGKYTNISLEKRDSLTKEWAKLKSRNTVYTMGQELEADKMVFIFVNKLENLLRVDLNIVDMEDTAEKQFGKGYALIKYREKELEKQIYDTALLTAIQRALASATKDTLLYVDAKGSFRVFPTPTIVIGGIDFQEEIDPQKSNINLLRWELLKNKEVNSFDAVESIFEEIYKTDKYIPYDVASRDSMFAYYGMYGIDNCHLPSNEEINILYTMEVDYYIFGVLAKIDNGAKITLSLNKVVHNDLITIRKEEGFIQNDDIKELRAKVKELANKLITPDE